ncbi:SAM-dependent methyltransferase [Catenovulum sp. 2E275]|uniref:SAM-dependent methyltransferase n=1 Tax=Catenovulum sp. 2E275 TaxID=2980497 RepID=UPI0021D0C6D1|nr:SAM-dependent methyltransferase [Catenovulum sp. 2E275]MCU4677383.1 SAM-dependent methyltransferase [Catenovulum sp. 2E275]
MSYQQQFIALTEQLNHQQIFWRDSAFYQADLDWFESHPELKDQVLALSDHQFDRLDQSPAALADFLTSHINGYATLCQLIKTPEIRGTIALHPRLNLDVPGRKWTQIEAFIAALPDNNHSAQHIVDWCAGKSYLGRAVANHRQADLHAIEIQPNLCESGEQSAKQWVKRVKFSCKDVLLTQHQFEKDDFVVALHACGDLHRNLIKQWRNSSSQQLVLAPCCYHQWFKGQYQPLSNLALQHNLALSRNQVRLAVQEMVTAATRIRKQVNLLGEWRMAFDLIQRQITGIDEYMPTPSLPKSAVSQGAEYVIKTLAQKKAIKLADDFDFHPFLAQAKAKYRQFQRLQLVSQGYRRALELWLVLDLVLYLEEAGCQVELASFCDRHTTPRNLRIVANRATNP